MYKEGPNGSQIFFFYFNDANSWSVLPNWHHLDNCRTYSQSLLCSAFSAKVQAMPPRCFMLSESWKDQWGDSRLYSCSEVLLLHNYPVTFCRCFAPTLAMEDQIALRFWVSSCPLCCDKMPPRTTDVRKDFIWLVYLENSVPGCIFEMDV